MGKTDHPTAERLLTQTAWVHELARALVRDVHLAEDAAQEACLAALRRVDAGDTGLRHWLIKLTRNAASKARRSESRRAAREKLADRRTAEPSTLEVLERFSVQQEVAAAVMSLEEPYREAVLLRFYEELPLKEVARRLGVSVATVDGRVRRGLERLRLNLDREYGQDGQRWALALLPLVEAPSGSALVSPLAALLSRPVLSAAAVILIGTIALRAMVAPSETRTGLVGGADLSSASDETELAEPDVAAGGGSDAEGARTHAPGLARAAHATGSLVVLIHEADGTPVQDLPVLLEPERTADASRPAAHRTDSSGTATFENLAPGEYLIRAGWGRATRVQVGAERSQDVRLHMPAGPALIGTVVDARGAPVPGAEVWISDLEVEAVRGGRLITTEVESEPVVRADGAGRIQLASIGAARLIGARASGYSPSLPHSLSHLEGDPRHVRLVLSGPGGAIEGVIHNSSGEPAVGASVYLDDSEGSAPSVIVRSDEDGRFRFTGVAPGSCHLTVHAPGQPRQKQTVSVGVGEVCTADFALARGVRVHGVVTDAEGQPVWDALVFASRLRWSDLPGARHASATRSAQDGSYELAGLTPGSSWVTVDAGAQGRHEQLVRIDADTDRQVDLHVAPGLELRGRVVDSDGIVIEGCVVRAVRDSDWSWDETRTDTAGRFCLYNCAPRPHTLRVEEHGFVLLRRRMHPGEGDEDLVVQAEARPSSRVRGTLVDAVGAPVDLREVVLTDHERGRTLRVQATSEADGSFRSEPFPPGNYSLTILPREREALSLSEDPLSFPARAEVDLGVHTLSLVELVELDFTRGDGEPLRDLRITLTAADGRELRRWAFNRAERFMPLAVHLPDGSYTMVAWAAGVRVEQRHFDVSVGQPPSIRTELSSGSTRLLRFRLPEGMADMGRLLLEIRTAGGDRVLVEEFGPGQNETRAMSMSYALEPGSYAFEAETSTGLVGTGKFVVRGGWGPEEPVECLLIINTNSK